MPSFDRNIILQTGRNGWLSDDEIDYFAQLLHQQFKFEYRETWKLEMPGLIEQINRNKKHIHLLHSMSVELSNKDAWKMHGGHWICTWFDTKSIHVYDSLNSGKLTECHKRYLKDLYPYFTISNTNIKFNKVQQQENTYDCGVFAIAFAISIAFGEKPERITYDVSRMRQHLLHTFETRNITKFPIITVPTQSRNTQKRSSSCSRETVTDKKIILNVNKENIELNYQKNEKINKNTFNENESALNAMDDDSKNAKIKKLKRTLSEIHYDGNKSVPSVKKSRNIENRELLPLRDVWVEMISNNERLIDEHIILFGKILSKHSDYSHQDTVLLQTPERITEIPPAKKHIQILYSNDDERNGKLGHWICSFYDAKNIYIYDSINNHSLHNDHLIFLQRLYPFYNVSNKSVRFMSVQNQTNSVDCGVFAIANAVTVLYREKPDYVKYDVSLMRKHLVNMYQTMDITPFPTISNLNTSKSLSIKAIQQKERHAYQQRSLIDRQYLNINDFIETTTIKENVNNAVHEERNEDISPSRSRKKMMYEEICNEMLMTNDDDNDATEVASNTCIINENGKHTYENYQSNKKKNYDNEKKRVVKHAKEEKTLLEQVKTSSNEQTNIEEINKVNRNNTTKEIKKKKEVSHETIPTKSSPEHLVEGLTEVIEKIHRTSSAESHLEAKKIVKWCIEQRNAYTRDLNRWLDTLRKTADHHLTEMNCNKKENKATNLCGPSRHTSSTESYYYEMIYTFNVKKEFIIVVNSNGQAINILPLIKDRLHRKKWKCDEYCRVQQNKDVLGDYQKLLERLSVQKLRTMRDFVSECFCEHSEYKLGHLVNCYLEQNPCKSIYFAIEMLASHFPKVRNIKRNIYKINETFGKLEHLDSALESMNLDTLRKISNEMKKLGQSFDASISGKDNLDEDMIQIKYKKAFIAMAKRGVAEYPCISCQKLNARTAVRAIQNIKNDIQCPHWKNLIEFVKENVSYSSEFICDYCLGKFRNNQLPPTCILNNHVVGDVPDEIKNLNDYERILIQRAKVFQVVQRAGTVQKRNIPHTMRIQKLVGQTFHLPLPMEETLDKIASTTDPINRNHELHILIRGIPTKASVVWQKLVNLEKVFTALKWLQCNNPLYANIVLPESAENLMKWLTDDDIEYNVELEENDSYDDDKEESEDNQNESGGEGDDKDINKKIVTTNNETEINKKVSITDELSINRTNNKIQEKNYENKNKINKTENSSTGGDEDTQKHSPMVTQILENTSRYEQYTFYPMHDKRINATACNLYQFKKVQDIPLNYNAKKLDLLCFPDIYPYGENGQSEERNTHIMDQEYIKLRLYSRTARFRLNQQYLFYLLNNTNIRQINSGIYHTLHVANQRQKYTANSYLEQIRNGGAEGNMNTIFERLRNSEQYWRKPRNNLKCMARHYGPATWFLTVSPAEWNWKDLILYVRRINDPYLNKLSDGEVIAADPVSVSRFIDMKFHALLDFLLSDDNPIGKIKHYFWRREYQGRGTQHFHLLIWVEEAPIVGLKSNEEVADFIMKYATCTIPDRGISPTLYRRVTTHQKHKHNSYCLRSKKEKSGKITQKCRFGFPRPETDKFILRDPAISIAGRKKLKTKSRFYDLPRNNEEVCINDYNPAILVAWEGNVDIQFIGESSSLLTQYCTKYSTKYEISKTSTVIDEVTSTKTVRQKLWNMGMRALQNRELGALEASDTLLGISLYGTDSDTTIKWLDVRMLRNRKVKKYDEIEKLDKESTDIFCPSFIDDYYPNRTNELDSICLYEFCKWYDIVRTEPKKEGVEYYTLKPSIILKRRERGYLINHWRHNINTEPENYFFTLLLLFKPWRDTDELRKGFSSYTESFENNKESLAGACEYHREAEAYQRGLDYITEQIRNELEKNDKEITEDNGIANVCDPKEGKMAMKEFNDIEKKLVKNVDLNVMIAQMNVDQNRIFNKVKNILTNKKTILRLYVSGEGGTGKSFLIDVIRTWISKEMNRKTAVTAPTGIAAFNINGLTIHRYFQLPIEHDDTTKYKQLSDNLLKLMREEMNDVELIIIDEISMVSNTTLMYINQRLMEIYYTFEENDGWFGKKHIIVFGDLLQLPPVRQDQPYVKLSAAEVEKRLGAICSINIWVDLFSYEELTINMRQHKDIAYGDLLSRLRVGAITAADIDLLETRRIDIRTTSTANRVRQLSVYINKLPTDAVCLLATRKQCECLNVTMLDEIYTDEIVLIAEDSVDCRNPRLKAKAIKMLDKAEKDDRSSAGLAKIITIKIGAKIMVRRNIDVTIGLVNGTIGVVASVVKCIDKAVEHIKSITIRLASGKECQIERMEVKFEIMNETYITRRQFPISLSYGITIHKSQGLSLQNAVIDVGQTIFTYGQTYVALSRVTTLEGVHLINFDPSSAKASMAAIQEYNRLRATYRPDLSEIHITNKHWQKVWDTQWAFETGSIDETNVNNKKDNVKTSINGLCNSNGGSSYANALIQCIFHSNIICKEMQQTPENEPTVISDFLKEYMKGSQVLDASVLRQFVGKTFWNGNEQDPIIYLEHMCNKVSGLRKHVQQVQTHVDRCKKCNYSKRYSETHVVTTLSINDTKQPVALNELIEKTLSCWYEINKYCDTCGKSADFLRKTEISNSNAVLIIKIDIFSYNKKKIRQKSSNWKLKTVPTSLVNLCNNTYNVNSAVLHSNEGINDHYTALVRDNKSEWIHIDDASITKMRWPRNSKNVYILFLEQIKSR